MHGELEALCALRCSYVLCRDTHVRLTSDGGEANEMFLFHGTCSNKPQVPCEACYLGRVAWSRFVQEVMAHEQGLDSRFATGGFYGQATYLAEDAAYPIAGRCVWPGVGHKVAAGPVAHEAWELVCRYAHRVAGTNGTRVQLLVVRAALGTQQACRLAAVHSRDLGGSSRVLARSLARRSTPRRGR